MDFQIVPFKPEHATEEEWNELFEFRRTMHMLVRPEDPLEPDEIFKRNQLIQFKNPEFTFNFFGIRVGSRLVGIYGYGYFNEESQNYEKNPYLAIINLEILPEYRKKGIGTLVLRDFYKEMKKLDKHIIVSDTIQDDGLDFTKKVGGVVALSNVENRLELNKVDWDMAKDWTIEGQDRSPNTRIMHFDKVPNEIIENYAIVFTETINQIPHGELEIEQIMTPKQIRRREEDLAKMDRREVTSITIEPDGEISGITWLTYNPHRATHLGQGLTAVREHHRGRGLGKWLKADMLMKAKKEFPDAKYIITGNATTNAPMLAINERLGFQEYRKTYNLQVKIDQLGAFLEKTAKATNFTAS